MIGLGVAASLMAGLKAIVMWFPRNRVAFVNGCMIMLGSLGAVTGYDADRLVADLARLAEPVRTLDHRDTSGRGLIYFAVPRIEWGFQTLAPLANRLHCAPSFRIRVF